MVTRRRFLHGSFLTLLASLATSLLPRRVLLAWANPKPDPRRISLSIQENIGFLIFRPSGLNPPPPPPGKYPIYTLSNNHERTLREIAARAGRPYRPGPAPIPRRTDDASVLSRGDGGWCRTLELAAPRPPRDRWVN